MNLVLFSGGSVKANRALSSELALLLAGKSDLTLAFIPADGHHPEDFRDCQRRFRKLGVKRFLNLPIDQCWSRKKEAALLSADLIFLGGGNTYYFLIHLREKKLLAKLKAYVRRGGLLLGLSAGSILMTPSVETAAVPSLDSDENDVGLRARKAMGLVPFEFSPHYAPLAKSDQELRRYSKTKRHPIYACADGAGIVIRNGELKFVGTVRAFHRGRKIIVQ